MSKVSSTHCIGNWSRLVLGLLCRVPQWYLPRRRALIYLHKDGSSSSTRLSTEMTEPAPPVTVTSAISPSTQPL